MKKPLIPENELARLASLKSYDILDSTAEEIFDNVTWIAALVCNVNISCISLIDKDRQWLKSTQGDISQEIPRDITFCAHAINQLDLMEVKDTKLDERFSDNPLVTGNPNIRFYAGMPLTNADSFSLGTLCVIDQRPKALTPLQKDILRRLSDIVIALFEAKKISSGQLNERLQSERVLTEASNKLEKSLRDMQELNHEMQLLSEVTGMLQACLNEQEAFASLAMYCGQLFPKMKGSIALVQKDGHHLEQVVNWGEGPIFTKAVFQDNECWGLRRSQVYKIDGVTKNMLCRHFEINREKSFSVLCVPMMALGETMGLLCLEQEDSHGTPVISDNHLILAKTLAEQSALALSNIKLRECLQLQTIKDSLTGLSNRRHLETELDKILHDSIETGKPVSVVMVDVDHFKKINDTYGHKMGDDVLQKIGEIFRVTSRNVDMLCRLGGDEFLLIFPNMDTEAMIKRAEELRVSTTGLRLLHNGSPIPPISLSLGIATFPTHGDSAEAIVQAADKALYLAKDAGRNQLKVFTEK